MKSIVVVSQPKNWPLEVPGVEVVAAKDYLTDPRFISARSARVYNLSREYTYQSKGYYVSLLAEARGHRVVPSVRTIQDLRVPPASLVGLDEIEERANRLLKTRTESEVAFDVYFAETVDPKLRPLGQDLHVAFEAPLLRVRFRRVDGEWELRSVVPLSISAVPTEQLEFIRDAMRRYLGRRARRGSAEGRSLDLAILINPEEPHPPSDKRALDRFARAAARRGMSAEFITREDAGRLAEFDALFIRENTAVNHHTYRMSRRAEAEGLAVIDDPLTILRCTNKVFLAELLAATGVATPRTLIVHRDNRREVIGALGLPCVLKQPDSAFSVGVARADTPRELEERLERLLQASDLVIAQEYTPTEFDWRIGVLEGEPQYACKYFMARGHWQILNWAARRPAEVEGNGETLAVEDAPQDVVDLAVRAANAVGSGLYGVDLKEGPEGPVVIEVNDNPNINAGVEDAVLGDALYDRIVLALLRRVQARYLGVGRA